MGVGFGCGSAGEGWQGPPALRIAARGAEGGFSRRSIPVEAASREAGGGSGSIPGGGRLPLQHPARAPHLPRSQRGRPPPPRPSRPAAASVRRGRGGAAAAPLRSAPGGAAPGGGSAPRRAAPLRPAAPARPPRRSPAARPPPPQGRRERAAAGGMRRDPAPGFSMLLFGVSLACYSPSLKSVQDQAYTAAVVLEGKVQSVAPPAGGGNDSRGASGPAGGVLVKVLDLWPLNSGGLQREQLISVGSKAPCFKVKRNHRYIFFLEPTEEPLVFRTAFAPLDTSGKNLKRDVARILCADCGTGAAGRRGPGPGGGTGPARPGAALPSLGPAPGAVRDVAAHRFALPGAVRSVFTDACTRAGPAAVLPSQVCREVWPPSKGGSRFPKSVFFCSFSAFRFAPLTHLLCALCVPYSAPSSPL